MRSLMRVPGFRKCVCVIPVLWLLPRPCSSSDAIGAGATFPAPIYAKWISSFETSHPDIHIRYEATGSEEGIRRLKQGEVDFAAADFPVRDADLSASGQKFLHVPTVVGAVVPIYNVPGFTQDLRLTPEILANIYLGKIKKWNDPAIKECNRNVKLPANNIVVVHRSDGSGTTFVLSDYLSKVSLEWRSAVGRGSTLKWPVGKTAKGNEGVASEVTRTPNSVGYVEFIYAIQHRLSFAAIRNADGQFVQADIESITAAAATVSSPPDDFTVSITNAAGPDSYPIASFTWFVVPAVIPDLSKRRDLSTFLLWVLSSGQRQAAALGYVSLPAAVGARQKALVNAFL